MSAVDRPITEIMTADVASVTLEQPISAVRQMMSEKHFHHVPVLDENGRLVGIITAADIGKLGFGEDINMDTLLSDIVDHMHPLHEVMSLAPVTIGHEQTVRKAAEMLATGDYHALPVVDADRKLLGIVTSTDLLRLLRDM